MRLPTKQKNVIFDSSIWIAFYLEKDLFHFEALRLIGGYERRKYRIYIPTLVLIEMITVLTKKGVNPGKVKSIIKYIQSTEQFNIYDLSGDALVSEALFYSHTNRLRTQDYIIFLHYVKLGVGQLESFDVQLQQFANSYQKDHENL